MKSDKYCFSKSVVMAIMVFLFLGIAAFLLSQLPRSQTITNTRAESPYLVGGVANSSGCYEYNNSSRCTQNCKKSHGNQYQCSGTTSLFCCLMQPTIAFTQNPTSTSRPTLFSSPTPTEGFAQKIMSFNLSNDQWELLNNAGFAPINIVPSGILNKMINVSFDDNIYVYDKNNEGGVSLSGFKGKILFDANVTILGLLSVTTPSDHYGYLVQMLYENGRDEEYLMEFYEAKAIKFLNEFKKSSYYTTNITPNIKQTVDNEFIYFPVTTQFLACQNKNINFPRVSESCLVFGYKEVPSGYEFEYSYLDIK